MYRVPSIKSRMTAAACVTMSAATAGVTCNLSTRGSARGVTMLVHGCGFLHWNLAASAKHFELADEAHVIHQATSLHDIATVLLKRVDDHCKRNQQQARSAHVDDQNNQQFLWSWMTKANKWSWMTKAKHSFKQCA